MDKVVEHKKVESLNIFTYFHTTVKSQDGVDKTLSDWSLAGTSSLGSLLAMTLSQGTAGSKDPVQKLDPDQLESYRRAFDEFDLDGDGKISTQELHLAFRRV